MIWSSFLWYSDLWFNFVQLDYVLANYAGDKNCREKMKSNKEIRLIALSKKRCLKGLYYVQKTIIW